jgi:glycolate oxidase iron-sulfur subunit
VQHHIPTSKLGPAAAGMARAVSSCVHCGFCLPACPTYRVLGEEMDSPRGRIVLMKQALEGELAVSDALPFIDRCLGCLACETACPSGVRYRELVVPFRAHAEATSRPVHARVARSLLLNVLESPARFRLAHAAGRLAGLVSPVLPAALRAMLQLLPPRLPAAQRLPEHVAAIGRRRARVSLLAGCVQRVLRPSINTATLRVLAANGVEVVIPPAQGCCGALALHVGHDARGARLADHNVRVFGADVDAIITNAAGCGSAMKEHGYAAPVQDVAEFLDALGIHAPEKGSGAFNVSAYARMLNTPDPFSAPLTDPITIAYHDACHLGHAQGVRAAPRRLLERIGNVTVVDIPDGEMCCGSAGLYNLEHPATAAELGRRKAAAIRATGAAMVATGNIGCLTQMETYLGETPAIPVRHTIEVLDAAYGRSGVEGRERTKN